jgi:pyrroloquinoline quinone (PQQ) biosynthesis protein C
MKTNNVAFIDRPDLELRKLPKTHSVYTHPFLLSARDQNLPIRAVKNFALQELFISLAFPAMMAEVVARIPFEREDLKHPIIENMFEEVGCKNPEQSHPNLLRNLARQLGATESEIFDRKPAPETQESLERLLAQCRSDYMEALTSIGYGNEYWLLIEYPPMKRVCAKHGVLPEVLKFFDVNTEADVIHTENVEKVMFSSPITQQELTRLKQVLSESLNARGVFYNGICRLSGIPY